MGRKYNKFARKLEKLAEVEQSEPNGFVGIFALIAAIVLALMGFCSK